MAKAGRDRDTSAVRGFPPLEDTRARVLLLGSMPGVASLRAQQYYGHPRNAFWPIMGELFEIDPAAAYQQRVLALVAQQVAVWDVLTSCVRAGSLDTDIERQSVVANDFAGFFDRHRQIRRVCFNGAMAEALFRRHVLPHLGLAQLPEFVRLPSTSPAHAGMSIAEKAAAWRIVHPRSLKP